MKKEYVILRCITEILDEKNFDETYLFEEILTNRANTYNMNLMQDYFILSFLKQQE
ncbi:MAG: hypothetical protein CM15mV42_0880 [uncultured marine virus]|nr:MAG: hypothetical protein CM15mV42_0880 [uncultured marine virus]